MTGWNGRHLRRSSRGLSSEKTVKSHASVGVVYWLLIRYVRMRLSMSPTPSISTVSGSSPGSGRAGIGWLDGVGEDADLRAGGNERGAREPGIEPHEVL